MLAQWVVPQMQKWFSRLVFLALAVLTQVSRWHHHQYQRVQRTRCFTWDSLRSSKRCCFVFKENPSLTRYRGPLKFKYSYSRWDTHPFDTSPLALSARPLESWQQEYFHIKMKHKRRLAYIYSPEYGYVIIGRLIWRPSPRKRTEFERASHLDRVPVSSGPVPTSVPENPSLKPQDDAPLVSVARLPPPPKPKLPSRNRLPVRPANAY